MTSEYMLCLNCVYPEKKLFDWGMMRLSRPSYGVGDAFAVDSDNHLKKKRDAEVIFYFVLCFFPSSVVLKISIIHLCFPFDMLDSKFVYS